MSGGPFHHSFLPLYVMYACLYIFSVAIKDREYCVKHHVIDSYIISPETQKLLSTNWVLKQMKLHFIKNTSIYELAHCKSIVPNPEDPGAQEKYLRGLQAFNFGCELLNTFTSAVLEKSF